MTRKSGSRNKRGNDPAWRVCLRCGKSFWSMWVGNRLCKRCNVVVDNMGPDPTAFGDTGNTRNGETMPVEASFSFGGDDASG